MLRKLLPRVVLAVVAVLADAWLLLCCRDLWANHARLHALARECEASGPRSTVAGRLRTHLAAYAWLGPLRPDAPRDPLAECGVPAADGGWWRELLSLPTVRWRRACLEDSMGKAEAGVHHGPWQEWLLAGACLLHLCVATGIVGLLAGSAAAPEVAQKADKKAAKAAKKAAPKAEQKAAPKADPAGPMKAGRRSSRVWQYLKGQPCALLARMRQAYRDAKELRSPKRRQGLEAAMQAELRRQRLKAAGHKVSVDSMDWWRGADDGSGKLVVRPTERLAEVFRPYRGLSPATAEGPAEPRPAGPAEPRPAGPEESRPGMEEERRPRAVQRLSAAAWLQPLLLLLNLIVLVYLCLRGGAAP